MLCQCSLKHAAANSHCQDMPQSPWEDQNGGQDCGNTPLNSGCSPWVCCCLADLPAKRAFHACLVHLCRQGLQLINASAYPRSIKRQWGNLARALLVQNPGCPFLVQAWGLTRFEMYTSHSLSGNLGAAKRTACWMLRCWASLIRYLLFSTF